MSADQSTGRFYMHDGALVWEHPRGGCMICLQGKSMFYAVPCGSTLPEEESKALCEPFVRYATRGFLERFDLTEAERTCCERVLLRVEAMAAGRSWCYPTDAGVKWHAPGDAAAVELRGDDITISLPKRVEPPEDARFLVELACWDILRDASLAWRLHRMARVVLHAVNGVEVRLDAEPDGEAEPAPATCGGAARFYGQ